MSKFDKTGTFCVVFDTTDYTCDGKLGDIAFGATTDHDMGANVWWIEDESRKIVWENTEVERVSADRWWWLKNRQCNRRTFSQKLLNATRREPSIFQHKP